MTNKVKHTPGPYYAGEKPGDYHVYTIDGGNITALPMTTANKRFIVRACNMHDELVALIERAHSYVVCTADGRDANASFLSARLAHALARARGEA